MMINSKRGEKMAKVKSIIKDCPFCGNNLVFEPNGIIENKVHHRTGELVPMGHRAYCSNCCAYGPKGKTKTEALRLWNKRAKV